MQSRKVTAFLHVGVKPAFYLTLVLPPGAVPTGGVDEIPGIVPFRPFCEAVVPDVSVGWEFVLSVVEFVLSVVVSLLRVVVCEAVVGVVMGAVVPLFLSLPQAANARETASAKNIARNFFIVISSSFVLQR